MLKLNPYAKSERRNQLALEVRIALPLKIGTAL